MDRYADLKNTFEGALAGLAESRYGGGTPVEQAVRYVLAGPGKRVRPLLAMLSAEAAGGGPTAALPAALAVEMVHTYSLVHDDLPCMDDDDLRRGRPTAHKVHGDAHALLAGDALLTDAFSVLAEAEALPAATRLAMTRELAAAAGGAGMVRGQSLDLHWTARQGATQGDLNEIHRLKTGCLLGAAAAMGALAGGATADEAGRCRRFGTLIGLAFQILDDLLDNQRGTGKSQGKDQAAGKLTYMTMMSPAGARAAADRYTAEAMEALGSLRGSQAALVAFARGLLSRMA